MSEADSILRSLDDCIRRDPGRRGLIGSDAGPLCPDDLLNAATSLAGSSGPVAIVTGFYIPGGDPPAAETDGPPGAVLLAETLRQAGIPAKLLTDARCAPAVQACACACGFPLGQVWPVSDGLQPDEILKKLPGLTHLIAIERVGPSHTIDSLRRQARSGDAPCALFEQLVPDEHRDRCHNMRGEIIDQFTAPMHRLFDALREVHPQAATIGIGDGGNELGMGRIPWEDLARRLSGPQAAWIPCRVATDSTLIAGVSNWGGYALSAATLLLRGQTRILREWTAAQQQNAIGQMVDHGPALDGVTRRREATVDGLPFLTYIQPWEAVRRLLGFDA